MSKASQTPRAKAKREIERAIGNLDWVEEHLKNMYLLGFGEREPYKTQLELFGVGVDEFRKTLAEFKDTF